MKSLLGKNGIEVSLHWLTEIAWPAQKTRTALSGNGGIVLIGTGRI
jgi:hypothetical protein